MNDQSQSENAKSPKVFGIGFLKTGTTSLETALKVLGYNTWWGHWENPNCGFAMALFVNRDYDELFKLLNYYDAFADNPWGGNDLYREIYKRLPDSKFILTLRDPERWYDSFENNLTKFDSNLDTALDSFHAKGRCGAVYFVKHIFGIESLANNKQKIIDHYNAHNQSVINFFAERNADFITFNMPAGDGWEKLCRFLKRPIPEAPFPHSNKRPEKEVLATDSVPSEANAAPQNTPELESTHSSPASIGLYSLIARIPLLRRPFYQRNLALQQRDVALVERDAAIRELDALRARLIHETGHP